MTSRKKLTTRPRHAGDDSADATQLIRIGAPTACPTCGSHTRPAQTPDGWVCLSASCIWSQ
jgi:hypothetical protein